MICTRSVWIWVRLLFVITLGASLGGCMLFGVRTVEEARYEVVEVAGDIELRDYAPVVVARTYVAVSDWDEAGGVGFRRLAGYIFGGNLAEESIAMTAPVLFASRGAELAMTAPVLRERDARGWMMSFVLPAEYTLESAPRPVDAKVELLLAAPRRVAALRYSGLFSEPAARDGETRLRAWVAERGFEEVGDPLFAGFDPPWTLPPLRRNEVWLEIR